jgi:dimethyl sulfoxide reductase iron-sulfur subunit
MIDPLLPTATGELHRREFLRVAAGAGLVAGTVAAIGLPGVDASQSAEGAPVAESSDHDLAAGAPNAEVTTERQWAFVVDMRLCDGCDACTEACQKTHYLAADQKWINVYRMTSAAGQAYFMPRLCMHCENAPCEKVCPVGATFKNDEGVILVDQKVCIGCRMCMAACPYEARYFNWDDTVEPPAEFNNPMPEFPVPQIKSTVGKCILCVHYEKDGKVPACVSACQMGALYIADLEADIATNGSDTVKLSTFLRANDAIRYREELGTHPRVYYILGHGQNFTYD